MSKIGKLILIPNFISETQSSEIFSDEVKNKVKTLDGAIVESEKVARALFRHFSFDKYPSFRELPMYILNEHQGMTKQMLEMMQAGKTIGLISDAGLPCLADPGADLIYEARRQGIKVETCGVPSAIIQALMLSGLSSQAFYFVGYMPKEEKDFVEKAKKLEKLSKEEKTTIIFIETPYRNEFCLKTLAKTLKPETKIAYLQDLGGEKEYVFVDLIKNFKIDVAKILKEPTVFVLKG